MRLLFVFMIYVLNKLNLVLYAFDLKKNIQFKDNERIYTRGRE